MPSSRIEPLEGRVIELLRQGKGVGSIAGNIGVPSSTLRDYVTKNNLRARAAIPAGSIPTGHVTREEVLHEEARLLRRELTKARRTDVATERIVAAIEAALQDVEYTVVFSDAPSTRPTDTAHHRQLVLWSDWHGGEQVDPETINGLNDYDFSIMESRVDEMLEGMLKHKKSSPELTGIDIALVGDQCSGANHRELAVTNEYPLAEQGVKVGRLMGRAIEHLAPHYEDVRVVSVVGNHPRLVQKPAAKDTHDNMDWVAAVLAKEYLRELPNLSSFVIGRTSVVHRLADRNFYIWHGDGIRTSMPGVPWGGVMRRVNEIGRTMPQRIDHYVLGHFHDPNVVQGGRILMNGSLKGVDEWVQKNFGGGSPPTQLLVTMDEKRSRLTDVKFLTPRSGLPY